ncbi:MAG: acyl-CoA thioesterase [Streptosporangiales bacterium]|nr:acyl-CoA thioesterase [Streptosporangiales bacterium]
MAKHRFHCPLRWGDVDRYDHVNNVVYVQYLEEARVDLFEQLNGDGTWDMLTKGVVVANLEVQYKRPLAHSTTPVPIDVWVSRVTASAFDLSYEIHDAAGTTYATALTTLVPYDLAAAWPRRLTPDERSRLESLRA